MIRRLCNIAFAGLISTAFVGCAIDTTVMIEHPAKVKPVATMSVVFADMLTILSNGATLNLQAVTKDSLHVAAGLPAGWAITGLNYYVATGLKLTKFAGATVDTQALLSLVSDSMQTYISRSLPMTTDNGNKSFFVGRQIKATNQAGDSLIVKTDSVPQWLVYGSKISLSFPVGTAMDTSMPMPDSLKKLFGSTLPAQVKLDSLGLKFVPIIVFATVKAGTTNGNFNLFYFTKTGKIDTTGSMVFATVNVDPSNAVRNPQLATAWDRQFNVFPNPFRANDLVTFSSPSPMNIGIYTAHGQLVRSLSSNGSRALVWNATSDNGSKLAPGTYFIESQGGSRVTKSIELLR
jgi:hypothetical protein